MVMTSSLPEPPTDGHLLRAALGGSPSSFGSLFERHVVLIYNHCFRHLASWAAAEDASSLVFLEAWRRRKDVRLVDESIVPWLLVVATNVCRNLRRSQWRHAAAMARLPETPAEPDFADDIVDRVGAEQQMQQLRAQINRLPARDQDVIALCVWEGLSYEHAAAALGVSAATVRSRLARARNRLRTTPQTTAMHLVTAGNDAKEQS